MIELSFLHIILLLIFGFFIGILGSVFGIGGGAFIVPFLVLVFKLPIKYAIAVSLVSIIAVSSSVASVNVEKGLANVRLGIFFEMPMALGSITGSFLMIKLPSELLQLMFAIIILPVAVSMYLKSKRVEKIDDTEIKEGNGFSVMSYYDNNLRKKVYYVPKRLKLGFVFSYLAGMMSGLFGLGGGIVSVPVMNILCNIPMNVAISTSNFMIGLSACASALILFTKGYVVGEIAVFMVTGVVVGGMIGIKILTRTKNSTLQLIFSFLLMIVSVRMMIDVFK